MTQYTYDLRGTKAQLYEGDCITVMRALPSASIDLVIADPPYKLEMPDKTGVDDLLDAKRIKLVNEDWDKYSLDGYLEFSQEWITEAMRLLKPHGSIFIFGSYHNIGLVNYVLQRNKIMMVNDIAWFKRNAVPNLACRRLQASYESIIWAAPSKKYNFNYQRMKAYPGDIIHKEGKQMRNVWDIPTNSAEAVAHPTQKPVAVYQRIIDVACVDGGTILDPFGGSGTLAIAASRKKCNSIMIERSPEYVEVIQDRIRKEKLDSELLLPIDGLDEPSRSPGASPTP